MMGSEILQITLTPIEKRSIKAALIDILYDPQGHQDYITAIRKAAYTHFPDRIIALLEQQKASLSPLPYFIFNNLPIDDGITGSPAFTQTGKYFKSGTLSENVLVALGVLTGEPYSIYFEGQELVNNLTPFQEFKADYTGLGSEVELDFHIENAALKLINEDNYSPMGLFLLGVRDDPNAIGPKTYAADVRLAIKLLNAADIAILSDHNFMLQLPYRWRGAFDSEETTVGPCPLISGPLHLPQIYAVFYPGMLKAINPRAENALRKFYTAIRSVAIGIKIQPGQLLYVDNRFTLHSRDKFTATYDQNGTPYRWIQRLFVAPNLWSFRSFTTKGARVFDPSITTKEKIYTQIENNFG